MSSVAPLRRHVRRAAQLEIRITVPGGDAESLVTRDLGVGGAFVATEMPLEPGTAVDVVLVLREPACSLSLRAIVRHHIDAILSQVIGSPAGMGLEFVDVPSDAEASLRGQMEALALAGGPPLDPLDVPDVSVVGAHHNVPSVGTLDGSSDWADLPDVSHREDDLAIDVDLPIDEDPTDEDEATPKDAARPLEPPMVDEHIVPYDFDEETNTLISVPPETPIPELSTEGISVDLSELESDSLDVPDVPEVDPTEWDDDVEDPLSVADTFVGELADTELQPIDDDTQELMRLEPVGPAEHPQVILALRSEAERLQRASYEDRLGARSGSDRIDVTAAHKAYVERYHRDLFGDVDDAEVDRLVAEIHELARAARDGLLARLAKARSTPTPAAPTLVPTNVLVRQGLDLLRRGHHQQARDLLAQAHRQDPTKKDVEAAMHLALGSLMKQYGRHELAMSHFGKAVDLDPQCSDAVHELRVFNQREDRKGMRILNLFRKKREKDRG